MSRPKVHTPSKAARGGLDEALKALGRSFAEAGLWRQAALAWKAHAQHFTRETLAAALAAHHRAAEASGAPHGAELPELEGMSDATKAAAADNLSLSADARAAVGSVLELDPSKTRGGTNVLRCQAALVARDGGGRCVGSLGHAGGHVSEDGHVWPGAAAELAAGGAPAPAGEGAEPPLGKIANTCSRAKETLRPDGRDDAREAGCEGRRSCLDLEGPGPLCPLHAALLSTLERAPDGWSWWIGVRGVPDAAYRHMRGARPGQVALARDREERPVWVPVRHLVSVPRPGARGRS